MKCDNVDRSQWRIPVWLVAVTCALVMLLGIGIGISVGKANPAKTGEPQQMQDPTANILHSDEISRDFKDYGYEYPVFGSDYQRKQIRSVTVVDTLADMPEDAWDVSEAGNGTVMAWVKRNEGQHDLYIGGEGGVSAGSSCEELFAGYENVTSINLGDCFDTSNVEDMSRMFYRCRFLEKLTLGQQEAGSVRHRG